MTPRTCVSNEAELLLPAPSLMVPPGLATTTMNGRAGFGVSAVSGWPFVPVSDNLTPWCDPTPRSPLSDAEMAAVPMSCAPLSEL
jgi:hypothetical protein